MRCGRAKRNAQPFGAGTRRVSCIWWSRTGGCSTIGNGKVGSLAYAQAGAIDLVAGLGGGPAVQLQPAGLPALQLESPSAPVLWVFVHYLVDGRAPAVPLPEGLLERARAEGRLD